VVGANPLQVALNVSLPMTMPALLYATVLVFFLGFEIFGLPLVLGDPEGHLVLATYSTSSRTSSARRRIT
jgi:iron(III) transport system permease protein